MNESSLFFLLVNICACKITNDMIFVLWLEIRTKVVVNLVAYVCLFQLHYSVNLLELECIANLLVVRICSVLLQLRILYFEFVQSLHHINEYNGSSIDLELPYYLFPCVTNVDLIVAVTLKMVELTILELSDWACWSLVKLSCASVSLIDANFFQDNSIGLQLLI
jgi:hypothetical protein